MANLEKIQMTDSGLQFSKFIQGYWRMAEWNMSSQESLTFLKQHVELGITTVDHAHIYGSPSCEQLFGEALKLQPSIRDDIEIVSKCGIQLPCNESGTVAHYRSDAKSIIESVDLSLSRLGVDSIDALLIHRPDFLMDADEVAEAFKRLEGAGKVHNFGVSNFSASQFSLLQSRLDKPLITNQIEINPINMQSLDDGLLDYLSEHRVIPMAWSCLGGGRILTETSETMEKVRATLAVVAHEVGAESIDQLIFAWVLALPSKPLPIIGSGKIDRVASAVRSSEIALNREQWYRIWTAFKGHAVP